MRSTAVNRQPEKPVGNALPFDGARLPDATAGCPPHEPLLSRDARLRPAPALGPVNKTRRRAIPTRSTTSMGAPPFALDRGAVIDNPCARQSLKDFVIIDELFRSGTGAVYKVRRRSDKRILVLKERRFAELGKRAPADHEANLLRSIGRHPHLIGCHGHFWERARLYVVLDYAAGGDLASLLKRRTLGDRAYFLPEAWVWTAFEQICRGLLILHERGVVHRDIKALNILVAPASRAVFEEKGVPKGLPPLPQDPQLRVADLGVSRQCSDNTLFLRTMFGTPLYASPEICDGTPYNEKTDVWSLGVVLYELCCLQPPFTANNLLALAICIKKGVYEPIGDHYSPLLKSVVQSCLNLDGQGRPSVRRLMTLCEDRVSGEETVQGLDEKTYASPPASPAKVPEPPAPVVPEPEIVEALPTARDARRLEALLRRRRTHLTNLRAAAALRDTNNELTPREVVARHQGEADVKKCERDVQHLVKLLREAVPKKATAPPVSPGAAWADDPANPAPVQVGESPAKARVRAAERVRRAREEDHHLGVAAADQFLFFKGRDQKKHRNRRDAMFGGRPAGFADGPPRARGMAEATFVGAAAPPRTAPAPVNNRAVLRREAPVHPAPPSLDSVPRLPPAPDPVPVPARAATASTNHRPARRDPPPPSRVVSRSATPRAPVIPGPPPRRSEESLPNYGAPYAKRGAAPAWRADVGATTNERERSNARLERLRRRGAARRARLEAAEPSSGGGQGVIVS